MKNRFIKHVEESSLFSKEDKLVIAISGGADSVALACLLFHSGHNICFAHCNFNLRGGESDQDEKFVKELSKEFNVECFIKSFDVLEYAKQNKMSIQMSARELRYDWFEEIREESNSKYIVVAHHQDDDIETFFINLIRGTGIRGFLGMKPSNQKIIRPLLPFTRLEIDCYLASIKQLFQIDSSNSDIKYLRNHIRKNLTPLVKEMNPSFNKVFKNETEYLNDVFKVYQSHIDSVNQEIVKLENDKVTILKDELFSQENYNIILREILLPYGFNQIQKIIESCQSSVSGKVFFSNKYKLLIDRQKIIVVKKSEEDSESCIIENGIDQIELPIRMKFSITDNIRFNSSADIAAFDMDTFTFPLELRQWKKGDFFYPLGMHGKKKLSDFFIDNKISVFEKDDCWLLCSGNDIIWVVGYRIDDRFKISENTKKAYIAELF